MYLVAFSVVSHLSQPKYYKIYQNSEISAVRSVEHHKYFSLRKLNVHETNDVNV